MRKTMGWLVVAGMATTTGLAVGTTAQANADCVPGPGGYEVDSVDGGSCTLEAAIAAANSNPGSTVVVPAGRYLLDGQLDIAQPMTILGAARPFEAEATVIDGASSSRVFDVQSSGVAISGVTITGGETNQTGAGIRVGSGATLVLTDSMIVDNHAREGGGVDVDGTAIIDSSTFVGNTASRKGGAVRADGFLTVVNSTFTLNSAQSGGAISVAGAADISFSTLVDNTSNNSPGGGLDRNGGTVTVTNSILTDANQSSSDGRDCSGTPDLVGANIVGNAQGCNPGPDVIVGRAVLGPLADNGGPTLTIALLDGSIGVDDALSCEAIGGITVIDDQRGGGYVRPAGADGRCDIGAFEINPLQVTDLALSAQSLEDDPSDEIVQVGVGATSLSPDLLPGAINQTAGLFEDGTIQANPLATFPLATFPLSTFPLSTFPLSTFPLATFPLSTFPLSTFPLATFPLSTFPLSTFPLATFPLDTILLSDLVLPETDQLGELGATWTQPDWDELLDGSSLEGTPLHAISLADLYEAIASGEVPNAAEIQALDIRQFNIESTPLSTFPLATFLLAGVPLSTFPLSTFDASTPAEQWCDFLRSAASPDLATALCSQVSDPNFTLATVALAGVPLEELSLASAPLSTFLIEALPLSTFPLSTFPLATFDWVASPLSTFPLATFDNPDAFVDCSGFPNGTCQDMTFADAAAAGLLTSATFADLLDELAANPALFDGYSVADLLLGLIPTGEIPWESLDLTVPGVQNAQEPPVDPFQYLADFTLSGSADEVVLDVTLPENFAYVPRGFDTDGNPVNGAFLDGTAVDDPVLSVPVDDPDTEADESQLITVTFELFDVAAGDHTLSIDVRAGLTLGLARATANIAATDPVVTATAGPVSTFVEVIERTISPSPLNGAALEIVDDEISLNYVTGTDDVDIYAFNITPMQAALGAQASILLSNLPADYDLSHYVELTDPLIPGAATDGIGFLDNVVFDLNPSDDVVQADVVQDIPNELPAGLASPNHVVRAVSAKRGTFDELIETGSLRAGIHYIQVSSYNGAFSNDPYALRIRVSTSPPRGACAAIDWDEFGDPETGGPATFTVPTFSIGDVPTDANTLFLMNTQVLRATYGAAAAADVELALEQFEDPALAAPLGVSAAIVPVDFDSGVRDAYADRHASPCDPELSNDVVREITRVIDDIVTARPGVENIVIVGDDRQIPMANVVDEVRFANERTFAQNFFGNNESIAALVAGMYRTDDVYGTDDWFRVRDHELYVPARAVGRMVETPTQIVDAADAFFAFGGRLDPDTGASAFDSAYVTGYEFLADGAQANVEAFEAGFGPDATVESLINETWTAADLAEDLATAYDIVGINGHFDEEYALAASGNTGCANPTDPDSCTDLFGLDDLPLGFGRTLVYSMGCHAGYSVSDIQIGSGANSPDWAQTFAGTDSLFAANSGYGYGDTLVVALGEQLTTDFASALTVTGRSAGAAWVEAKQQYLSDLVVIDGYHEKTMMQFVFYGLPMYHVGESPSPLPSEALDTLATQTSSIFGPEAESVLPTSSIGLPALGVQAPLGFGPVPGPGILHRTDDLPGAGSYFDVDGNTYEHSGLPIQPLNSIGIPAEVVIGGTPHEPRDALVTELVSEDLPGFDPVFFRATTDDGGNEPRAEYLDGSFPAEMAAVGLPYLDDGVPARNLLLSAGQYRGSTDVPDLGTQRLHTYTEVQVFYGPAGVGDTTPPLISRSAGFRGDGVVFFDVEAEDLESGVERVYVMFRQDGVNGAWTGVDLVRRPDGVWRGGWPFAASAEAEYFVQAVNGDGLVSMSNAKALNFNTSVPVETEAIALTVTAGDLDEASGWYVSDVTVEAAGAELIYVSADGGAFAPYDPENGLTISGDGAHVVVASDNPAGAGSSYAILYVAIDGTAPAAQVTLVPDPDGGYANESVAVAVTSDDGEGAGISSIVVVDSSGTEVASSSHAAPEPDSATLIFDWSTEGVSDLTATVTDAAGNNTTLPFTISIDTIAPTLTSSRTPDVVWAGISDTVTVFFEPGDPGGSGVADVFYTLDGSSPLDLDGDPSDTSDLYPISGIEVPQVEGTTAVRGVAFDQAGNASNVVTEIVRYDLTRPTVTLTPSGDQPYTNGDVSVGVTATDTGGSILDGVYYTLDGTDPTTSSTPLTGTTIPVSRAGTTVVSVIAVDGAGNVSAIERTSVNIDRTPPTIDSLTKSPDLAFAQGDVTVTVVASDTGGSGVTALHYTLDGTTPTTSSPQASGRTIPVSAEGTTVVRVIAVDGAGNVSTVASTTIRIDRSNPIVTKLVLSDDTATIGGTGTTATFSCADPNGVDPSGIAPDGCVLSVDDGTGFSPVRATNGSETTVVLPATGIGTYDVRVIATDRAGRTSTRTGGYGVGYGVCLLYDESQVKNIGSNYTIRLALCDGAGNNLSARSTVLTAVSITDANGANVAVPEYSGSSNQPFTFRYRSSDDSYIYNLDTTGMPAGDLTMRFTASTTGDIEYVAPFRLG